jgi:hypothetical protein
MLGGTSQRAGAAPQPAPLDNSILAAAGTAAAAKVEWTAVQDAAAAYVTALATQPFGPCPMLYVAPPAPVEPEIVEPPPMPDPEPEPQPDPEPVFTLQALMAAPTGDKALINGRAYIKGERIADSNWEVRVINVSERSVTLQNVETYALQVVFVQGPR